LEMEKKKFEQQQEAERLKAEIARFRAANNSQKLQKIPYATDNSSSNNNNINNNNNNNSNYNSNNNNNYNNNLNSNYISQVEQQQQRRLLADIESLKKEIGNSEKSATQRRIDELEKQREFMKNELHSAKSTPTKIDPRMEERMAELEKKRLDLQRELSSGPSKEDLLVQHDVEKKELSDKQFGVDVCFLIDCTASMKAFITAAKESVRRIVDAVRNIDQRAVLRFAFVGYRDYGDEQQFEQLDFLESSQAPVLEAKLASIQAYGGGDGPEDIAGGLDICCKLTWKASTRLLIHIADAPCHGNRYHKLKDDRYPQGDPKGLVPEELLKKLLGLQVDYYFLRVAKWTDPMVIIFKKVYERGHRNFEQHGVGNDPKSFLPKVVASIHSSMAKSVAFFRH